MDCRGTRLEAGRPVRPLAFCQGGKWGGLCSSCWLNMVWWTGFTHGREQACVRESHPDSEVCVVLVPSLRRVRLLQPHGLQPTRLLCPWNSPGKNTAVGCHFLLQGIFPAQESTPDLQHCRQMLYRLAVREAPEVCSLGNCGWQCQL